MYYAYTRLMKYNYIQQCLCSCEVVPNRTGSLLFTNNPAVTTLSETFLLKDSMARGFQRYFSVVVGNQQRGNLIRSWSHLSQGTL